MTVERRQVMLGTLDLGVTLASGPRTARARASTYGIVPGAGIDQTASLQEAADQAAKSGTPFFLPPGDYTTTKLELKSGTQIQGAPGTNPSFATTVAAARAR
ncbi:MAG TPA: glycosyl hydrolase family 28-related protein [Methyloceanibacter sp.]|nr:glycosyl hydrolase family 28-related protein [Methyloceanibacter sp.]